MKYLRKRQLGLLWLIAMAAALVVMMLLLSIAPAGAQQAGECYAYDDHGICTAWESDAQDMTEEQLQDLAELVATQNAPTPTPTTAPTPTPASGD